MAPRDCSSAVTSGYHSVIFAPGLASLQKTRHPRDGPGMETTAIAFALAARVGQEPLGHSSLRSRAIHTVPLLA